MDSNDNNNFMRLFCAERFKEIENDIDGHWKLIFALEAELDIISDILASIDIETSRHKAKQAKPKLTLIKGGKS